MSLNIEARVHGEIRIQRSLAEIISTMGSVMNNTFHQERGSMFALVFRDAPDRAELENFFHLLHWAADLNGQVHQAGPDSGQPDDVDFDKRIRPELMPKVSRIEHAVRNQNMRGLLVIREADRLPEAVQQWLIVNRNDVRSRLRIVLLVSADPGDLMGAAEWRSQLRSLCITVRWPTKAELAAKGFAKIIKQDEAGELTLRNSGPPPVALDAMPPPG